APRPLGGLVALALMIFDAFLVARTLGELIATAGALPPVAASLPDFVLAAIAWLATEWARYLAIGALIAAAAALIAGPSPPVARAIWRIVSDLLPPLILI